jgi:hypothetical protein
MNINVFQDYGQMNVSSKRHVDNLINQIKSKGLSNDKSITLDLTTCQTDYPETPKFIDFLLNHLSSLEGKKKFKIIFNGLGINEIYILHDLILEGKYFGIYNKINSPDEVNKWTKIMNSKLKIENITLTILYTPDNKTYTYGE